MKKDRFLAAPALTIPLAMLAACVSMWSNNWHMYGWKYLGACLGFLLILSILLFLAVGFVYKRRQRWLPSKYSGPAAGFLICLLAVVAALVLLDAPINGIIYNTGLNPGLLSAVVIAVVSLLVYFAGFKTLNVFLALWLCAATADGVHRITSFSGEGGYYQSVDLRVELKTKPNIYLFYLESYHSLPVLEEVFGIDPNPVRNFLNDNGFFIYEPVMSNSPFTLGSMAETFTFQLSPIQPSGFIWDVMPDVRNAIGGSKDNTLFRIMKENGYRTTFFSGIKPMQYFFNVYGPYLDDTDANMRTLWVKPFYDLNEDAFEFLIDLTAVNPTKAFYDGGLPVRVKKARELSRKKGQPLFVSFKGGADHVKIGEYFGTPDNFEEWKPEYRKLVAKGNRELMLVVESIVKDDPDSVIVMVGDHGAHWYHELFAKQIMDGDVEGFQRVMAEYGLTQEQVTDSFFSVLLAIRLPGGRPADISHGLPMSHVNLFRHVFAYLNDDPELLKDRAPTRSAYVQLIMARDNQPVCERLNEK